MTDVAARTTTAGAGTGIRRAAVLELAALAAGDLVALGLAVSLLPVPSPAAPAFVLVALALLVGGSRFRARPSLRVAPQVPGILGRVAVAGMVAALLAPEHAAAAAATALAAFLGVVAVRLPVSRAIKALRIRGALSEPTLVLGSGVVSGKLAAVMAEHPEYGLRPVGFLDGQMAGREEPPRLGLPLLGSPTDLERVVAETGARHLVVGFGVDREHSLLSVLRSARRLGLSLHVVPRFFDVGLRLPEEAVDDLFGWPLIEVRREAPRAEGWRLKRVFDLVVSAGLLALLAPLIGLIALAVKLTSQGPVLFRQKRVGMNGEVFEVLKFRTMTVNDDADTTWAVEDDPRVTAVGRVLRPSHLDELPQLINVIRGEMSLVGPRPERPYFVDQFSREVPRYEERHRVPPGITGLGQVHGLWGDTSIEDRVVMDNRYIENWSLWADVVILVRTIPTLVGRRAE